MNKLNFRTRAKCIHKIFGIVECTDYFTSKENAIENAEALTTVQDTIGVIYVEQWTKMHWKIIETVHF